MDAIDVILTRKSTRTFKADKVEKAFVDTILQCGYSAPSADNMKGWEFIVIDDKEVLASIGDISQGIQFVKDAPLGIAICANISNDAYKGFWVSDCSTVAENMLLAAHALGLGAVWAAIHPLENRMLKFAKLLNLPKNILPLCVIAIGATGENTRSVKKEIDHNKVHINKW